jgi:hypothetical protein
MISVMVSVMDANGILILIAFIMVSKLFLELRCFIFFFGAGDDIIGGVVRWFEVRGIWSV